MMMTSRLNTHSRQPAVRAAVFLICAAVSRLAFAQEGEPQAIDSGAAAEGHHEHSGMHASPSLDLSESSEVGEANSLVSPESTTTVNVSNYTFSPSTVTIGQGQTVRWDFQESTHTASDSTAMGLFDSGYKSTGESFEFLFQSAGIYPFHCQIHSNMQGAVQVPIKVSPASGTTATAFKIIWSSVPANPGYVFDVQIKRPGARSFMNWKMGRTKRMAAFTPAAGPGKYSFRARLRKTNNNSHSLYSPFRTIDVQ